MNAKKTLVSIAFFSAALTVSAQQNGDTIAEYESFGKYRVGGYGEAVAAFKDYGSNRFYGHPEGNAKENRNTISIPRLVIAGDYKFNSKWILGLEIEFESGGTGTAYELENTENGEYETEVEKGGEVAVEQFHITRLITPAFNVRAGHIIVPSNHNGEQMRVVPGDADGSLLYQSMTSNMLPSKDHTGYFTDKANIRLLNMLKAWIDGGAKNE